MTSGMHRRPFEGGHLVLMNNILNILTKKKSIYLFGWINPYFSDTNYHICQKRTGCDPAAIHFRNKQVIYYHNQTSNIFSLFGWINRARGWSSTSRIYFGSFSPHFSRASYAGFVICIQCWVVQQLLPYKAVYCTNSCMLCCHGCALL